MLPCSAVAVLVLGGDCTVELGTVAGALSQEENIGLVYIDLDTDLNTPESTEDGALDWMGVAHMLGVQGSIPELVSVGSCRCQSRQRRTSGGRRLGEAVYQVAHPSRR